MTFSFSSSWDLRTFFSTENVVSLTSSRTDIGDQTLRKQQILADEIPRHTQKSNFWEEFFEPGFRGENKALNWRLPRMERRQKTTTAAANRARVCKWVGYCYCFCAFLSIPPWPSSYFFSFSLPAITTKLLRVRKNTKKKERDLSDLRQERERKKKNFSSLDSFSDI